MPVSPRFAGAMPIADSKAPIVVWLYGGASYLGAGHLGSYHGAGNAMNGVITIPINCRLGSLGSFAHPALTKEGGPTGGFALMDAVAHAMEEYCLALGETEIDCAGIQGHMAGGATTGWPTLPATTVPRRSGKTNPSLASCS